MFLSSPFVSTLGTNLSPQFASFQRPSDPGEPGSSRVLGGHQTWPMQGANYANTRYLPLALDTFNDGYMDSLALFTSTPLPVGAQSETFMGVVDELHFFALGRTQASLDAAILTTFNFAHNVGMGAADSLLMRISRQTGKLEQITSVGEATDLLNATARGPLFLYGDHVYLPSALHNQVWKFFKMDFALIWQVALPHWRPIQHVGIGYSIYYTVQILVIPPQKQDGDPIVVVTTSAGNSYGPHGTAFTPAPDLQRLVQYHFGVAYVFGVIDSGTYASLAFEFSGAPLLLQEGQLVPDESFAPGEETVLIWEKLVDGEVFSKGSPTSGQPKTTGNFVFPIPASLATSLSTGMVTFDDGDVFNVSREYTLRNVTSADGSIMNPVTVDGTYLASMPFTKTVFRNILGNQGHRLSASEAWGLNYYGGSMYGNPCYDEDTGTLYVASGNAYSYPVSDQLAVQHATDQGRFEHIANQYTATMSAAYDAYEDGNHSRGFSLSNVALSNYKDAELRRRAIRSQRSPRYQRFFTGSVIALQAVTNSLQWAFPVLGHDQKDTGWWYTNPLSIYQEDGSNHDICSVAISTHGGVKRLIAAGKVGVGVYDLDSQLYGFIPARKDDVNGDAGLTNMIYPELRVDIFMKQVMMSFGGLVTKGDTYYMQRSVYFSEANRALLPVRPVEPDSPLLNYNSFARSPVLIYATSLITGELKWLRIMSDGSGFPNSGGIVGYGDALVVGDLAGKYHIIDMETGKERAICRTAAAAVSGAPVVNGQVFHLGGASKWDVRPSYAYDVEILTPMGV